MDLETRLARLKESVDRGFINKAEYENCVRIAKLELTPEARAADRGFINKAEYENCVTMAKLDAGVLPLELTPEARAADTDKVEVEPNNVL